ncbi:MCE family protein [Phaeacidiphilus oryzae]|uniref:MCE family protein n=1 Tax=Phaeacidiphilus oryzae TaxID=348818 RepID=UPI00068C9831|nr:MlaD family protein [Phaeacidiphilus oryzae]
MISRLVRFQLVAFVLLTVVGVVFASVNYVRLPQLVGIGRYRMSVDLPDSGQLYANAIVTLRGVQIGRVDDVHLTPTGARADLSIDDGTRIPASSTARIRVTSAIGEQYVDFVPAHSGPPYLTAGQTVPKSAVSLPTPVDRVLGSASQLAASVPLDKLRITVDEAYRAFAGSSGDLQRMLDALGPLLNNAQANVGPTAALIAELAPVLRTQQNAAPDITGFSRNLSSFTTQLKLSDADLRGTLDQGPAFAQAADGLIGRLAPTLPTLLANLTSLGQVLDVYIPSVTTTLSILPADIDIISAVSLNAPPGWSHMDFLTGVNKPPSCTTGFTGGPQRDPTDTSKGAVPQDSYCKIAHDSASDVRGSRNNPCPNDPSLRSATAAGCGLDFTGSAGSSSASPTATYDASTGLMFSPDGKTYQLGPGILGPPPSDWRDLLLNTLAQNQ